MRGIGFAVVLLIAVGLGAVPPASAQAELTRFSVTDTGAQAAGGSWWPSIDAAGRFVAFQSWADNFGPTDTNSKYDIYVRDRMLGLDHLISTSPAGTVADGQSLYPAISADGFHVAFCSEASNFVAGDTNGVTDVYVSDWQRGVVERVSVSSTGEEANGPSWWPQIGGDGRYVVFQSAATNLLPGGNSHLGIYLRDRQAGTTECLSVKRSGEVAGYDSYDPWISPDGGYVVFCSWEQLVPENSWLWKDIFLRDLVAGTIEAVSVADQTGQPGNDMSGGPHAVVTPDGRYVAFSSWASNLVPSDTNGQADVFVRDRVLGRTTRVSVSSSGEQGDDDSGGDSVSLAMSSDGRYVMFSSRATNLVPDDTNGTWDAFVHDLQTGQTTRMSVSASGQEGDGASGYHGLATSATGAFTVWDSGATNLVPGDTNKATDTFLYQQAPAPTAPAVVIDGDAAFTTTPDVTLSVAAGPRQQVRFRNESGDWSPWEPALTTKAWTLSDGEGTKWVSVEGQDAQGTVSPESWDEIIYDATPPSGVSVVINGGAATTSDRAVTLAIAATGAVETRLHNDREAWSPWEPYAAARSCQLSQGDGLKRVTLQMRDGAGNLSAEAYSEITLGPAHALAVSASASPATVASGGSTTLGASATDTWPTDAIASWSWDDGGAGGSFSPSNTVQNPSYAAPANTSGNDVTVTLTVSASCTGGVSGSDSATLTVNPVAHTFAVSGLASPPIVASGGSTSLAASTTDSRTGHTVSSWSWSDGGAGGVFSPSASVQNPSFTAPGNASEFMLGLTLTVSATCDGGGSDSDTVSISVQPADHALSVGASPIPADVASSGTTALAATASDAQSHGIASWSWSDSGAGGSFSDATAQNPSYTAPANTIDDDVTVTLTVVATCSGSSPISGAGATSLTVHPVAHTFSVAAATPSPAAVASGGGTSLSATPSDSRTGHSVTWSWSDGGAGGSFSDATAQGPTYTAPTNNSGGDLIVTLTVSASCSGGGADSDATTLTVHALPPTANFSGAPLRGKSTLAVDFSDLSLGVPDSWVWDFGDGSTSTDQSPSHTYVEPGVYNVGLTIANASGSDSKLQSRYVKVSFLDVAITPIDPVDSWALGQILACVGSGIVTGYGDGTYRPEDSVTRDQMAVYISRALSGGDAFVPSGPSTATFTDVPTDFWAFRYVEYAVEQGVVTGYEEPDGSRTYRPSSVVDRGQMAVYVARALTGGEGSVPTGPAVASFPDVPTDFWAFRHVEYVNSQEVATGYSDGTYRPAVVVTRDQMAVYVQRAFRLPM